MTWENNKTKKLFIKDPLSKSLMGQKIQMLKIQIEIFYPKHKIQIC